MKFSIAFLIVLGLSGLVNIQASPAKSSSELHDVLDEFLALVPKEKVIEVYREYLSKDAQVQAVLEYIKTDEFKKLVQKVESIDDVTNFYDYLNESGLDIYGFVNKLHDVIGLPPLVPGKPTRNVRITGGFAGLIKDIKAILPLDDIKALYHEKLENSPSFVQLIERLRSPKLQKLIDELRANEEFEKIVKFCYEAGVDIKAIKDLLTTIFGLEFPDRTYPRPLNKNIYHDFLDFINLLPTKKILEITADYVKNDSEIRQLFVYISSVESVDRLFESEATKEEKNVLDFIQDSGIDIYAYFESIRKISKILPFQSSSLPGGRTGGIAGYVADITDIIPTKEIEELHEEKLKKSPAFARLSERLRSQEFKKLLDAVHSKGEVRVILNEFKAGRFPFINLGILIANAVIAITSIIKN